MADIPISIKDVINGSEITNAITPALSGILGPLIPFIQAIGIIVIIYFVFLIIKSFLAIRHSLREGRMTKDISEINGKLSILIERLPGKKSRKDKKEEK